MTVSYMTDLSIFRIVEDTTVDGPGFRTSIYSAGCTHGCTMCHNPQSWNISNGKIYTVDMLLEKVKSSEFANVTFTGGDPLMQVEGFTQLAKRIRLETDKTIWCYTGYTFEQVLHSEKLSKILPYLEVLVDGRFDNNLKDESIRFRGSTNQRLIDVQRSLVAGCVIEWQQDWHSQELLPVFLPYFTALGHAKSI